MSTALATLGPAELQSPAQYGSGTALQTLAGTVSAFFALERFNHRRGVATYALRVVNRTSSALICRTWIISRDGDAVQASPLLVEVAPLATSLAHVPVRSGNFASVDRTIAEIVGDGVHCVVEAPPPVAPRARRSHVGAVAISLAGLFLLGAAGTLRGEMPRIAAFAVPPEAMTGTTIHAEYDVSGSGRLSYAVRAPDGRTIQGGALQDASGSIPIPIRASQDPGAYTLEMQMKGPLGTATATRVLNTLTARPSPSVARMPGGAQISSISVQPLVARPGQTINVAYAAQGDAGYVRLTGDDGTVWQQRPFSRYGDTQLTIPPVSSLREMRVVVHVVKGRTAAQSMAGVLVANTGTLGYGAASPIAGDNDPVTSATAASSDTNDTFQVVEPTVKSGGPIHVKILSPHNGMRIALTDAQSHEITGTDVGTDTESVTMRAPVVWVATRYTVVVTFTDGFGQESVVAPVTIVP